MIPVLGIPQYNRPDLLRRCLESVDYPVADLVIIQNGPDTEMPSLEGLPPLIRKLTVVRHPNAGVAASWNEIIQLFPAAYWMLVNNDIAFAPGDLERMHDAAVRHRAEAGCLYSNHGASFWCVTEWGVFSVGLFDENFYPAYLEDCDWTRRADLAGIRRMNVEGCHSAHGDERQTGSCTANATPELAAKNCRTHSANFEYYKVKWGGINGEEKFSAPYNRDGLPVWAWRFVPGFRASQQW